MRLILLKLVEYLVLNIVEVQRPLTVWIFSYLKSHVLLSKLYVYLHQHIGIRVRLMLPIRLDPHVKVVHVVLLILRRSTALIIIRICFIWSRCDLLILSKGRILLSIDIILLKLLLLSRHALGMLLHLLLRLHRILLRTRVVLLIVIDLTTSCSLVTSFIIMSIIFRRCSHLIRLLLLILSLLVDLVLR